MQADLFTALTPPCGECPNLGQPIDSGIRYCWGAMTLRWAHERVDGCPYRARPVARFQPAQISRADNLRDLLESPRHSISEKDRNWLRAELRKEIAR